MMWKCTAASAGRAIVAQQTVIHIFFLFSFIALHSKHWKYEQNLFLQKRYFLINIYAVNEGCICYKDLLEGRRQFWVSLDVAQNKIDCCLILYLLEYLLIVNKSQQGST